MAEEVFKWHSSYKKKPIVSIEEAEKATLPDFYNVDKITLEKTSSKESRLCQLYIKAKDHDSTILNKINRVVGTIVATTTHSVKKPSINFNHLEGNNSASFAGERINVSLTSLYDHRIPLFMRINNVIATSFHEALHIQHTTPGVAALLMAAKRTKKEINAIGRTIDVPDFKETGKLFDNDNKLYMLCHNIVEDRRIEALGVKRAPGYVYYLEASRSYAIFMHHISIQEKKNELKEMDDFKNFWDAIFLYILYKVLLPEVVPFFLKHVTKKPYFNETIAKVNAIVGNVSDDFKTVKEQSKQLYELFPKNYKNEYKNVGAAIFIATDGDKEITISKELRDMIEKECTSEENKTKEMKLLDFKDSFSNIDSIIEKAAPINPPSFEVFDKAKKLSKQFSKNFTFVDSKYNRFTETFELQSGAIEEGDLAIAKKNKFIFFEEDPIPHYNLDFGVLIDESGSMSGDKIEKAKAAAIALTLALNQNKFINFFVWGHSANTGENRSGLIIFNYYNSENRKSNINTLFGIRARGNNADGFAINYVGDFLARRRSRKKVLVVISDGAPHAEGYGGLSAIQHTKQMVDLLESRGVYVVQIAIDSLDSSKMFKNFIEYSEDALGTGLKKILSKQLIEISNQI